MIILIIINLLNMNSQLGSFVRYFDFSQANVTLKVNKSDSYASFTGGLCSLIMIMVIGSFGFSEMLKVFSSP